MNFNTNGLLQLTLEQQNIKYLNTLPLYLFNDIEMSYVEWIYDYVKKYSKIPTLDIFKSKFKTFRESTEIKDVPIEYYYDEFKPIVLELYINSQNKLQKEKGLSIADPTYISELSQRIKLTNPDYIVYSEFNRDEYFKNIKKMSWGIKFLDEWFGSLNSTDLIGIFGRLKSNKTTFLQVIGYVLFYQQKRNILVFSNENTPLQFAQVFDSFLGNFNNKKFRTLEDNDLTELKDKIDNVVLKKLQKHKGEIVLAGSAKTPSDIIAAIRNCKHKPDVILLDGLHAMSFSNKDTGSQSLSIADTMKQLRQITYDFQIPIIFVTQGNRTASKTDEPGAESVALSDSIPQYADGLMGCTLVQHGDKVMCKVYCTANRFGIQGLSKFMHINWDNRKVDFYDIKEDETLNMVTVNDEEYIQNLDLDEENEGKLNT